MATIPEAISLSDLRRVHQLVTEKFPHEYLDVGLGAVGLFLVESVKNAGYQCTPLNSLTFAGLGVDGIHIGSVTDSNEMDPLAPIVITIPMASTSRTSQVTAKRGAPFGWR